MSASKAWLGAIVRPAASGARKCSFAPLRCTAWNKKKTPDKPPPMPTVVELKKELRKRGLDEKGKKAELEAR
eukprot:COSAG06_NODE_10536_length_1663_cov_1580.142583_4_plen_71_part_01